MKVKFGVEKSTHAVVLVRYQVYRQIPKNDRFSRFVVEKCKYCRKMDFVDTDFPWYFTWRSIIENYC